MAIVAASDDEDLAGRTLADHAEERATFVRQLLERSGVRDPDVPTRPALLLQAISQRQRWKADYDAAVLRAGDPPDQLSTTTGEAA